MPINIDDAKIAGFFPRKKFSQNFLTDKNVADKIVRLPELTADDTVIEIGPGRGILTEGLLKTGAKVIAVEIDRNLASAVAQRFHDNKNLEIINADALKLSYKQLSEECGKKLKVVSNLPYHISTPIIFKFLEEKEAFSTLVLMLQREVAQRIIANPGSKDYGVLSVFVQIAADVKIKLEVPPSCFYPKPKVYSSVVRFDILDKPKVKTDDSDFFKSVVKAAFGQRRKTLLNALKALELPVQRISDALKKACIDPQRRGETLSLEEFCVLSSKLREIA